MKNINIPHLPILVSDGYPTSYIQPPNEPSQKGTSQKAGDQKTKPAKGASQSWQAPKGNEIESLSPPWTPASHRPLRA
jgi:hypothetical protein